MKELSIEEKAKAYDEALERARNWKEKSGMPKDRQGILDDIFPELKESEDERIRKELLEHCKNQAKPYIQTGNKCPQIQSWIAWLEKQGEQKPTIEMITPEESLGITPEEWNEIEDECIFGEDKPKFKVGDWVVDSCGNVWEIKGILNQFYILECVEGGESRPTIEWVDKTFHLWTIQDAKDGDVLASELCDTIMLYKGIRDNNIQFYCDYDFSDIDVPGDRFAINNGQHYGSVDDSDDWHPATKEQRDTLFAKMKEAGYKWMLKRKIEQKPKRDSMMTANPPSYGY